MPLSGRCRRAGSSDSDAREPLFRSEAVQAAARRPHQKVLGWRLAGATPRHQFHENCENRAFQEVGERDPGEIPPGRHFRQSALMNSRSSAAKSDRA